MITYDDVVLLGFTCVILTVWFYTKGENDDDA